MRHLAVVCPCSDRRARSHSQSGAHRLSNSSIHGPCQSLIFNRHFSRFHAFVSCDSMLLLDSVPEMSPIRLRVHIIAVRACQAPLGQQCGQTASSKSMHSSVSMPPKGKNKTHRRSGLQPKPTSYLESTKVTSNLQALKGFPQGVAWFCGLELRCDFPLTLNKNQRFNSPNHQSKPPIRHCLLQYKVLLKANLGLRTMADMLLRLRKEELLLMPEGYLAQRRPAETALQAQLMVSYARAHICFSSALVKLSANESPTSQAASVLLILSHTNSNAE